MIGKYKEIKSDLFNISGRLKKIDSGYFVVFNYKKQQYEVHNRFNKGSSYCLGLPFDRLDYRTIDYVYKTRSENVEALFKEIEWDNERLIKEEHYKITKQAESGIEEIFMKV